MDDELELVDNPICACNLYGIMRLQQLFTEIAESDTFEDVDARLFCELADITLQSAAKLVNEHPFIVRHVLTEAMVLVRDRSDDSHEEVLSKVVETIDDITEQVRQMWHDLYGLPDYGKRYSDELVVYDLSTEVLK